MCLHCVEPRIDRRSPDRSSCGRSEQTAANLPTVGAGGGEAVRDHGFPPAAAGSSFQGRIGRSPAMTVIRPRPLVGEIPRRSRRPFVEPEPSASLSPRAPQLHSSEHAWARRYRARLRVTDTRHHLRLDRRRLRRPVRTRRCRDAGGRLSGRLFHDLAHHRRGLGGRALRVPHPRPAGRGDGLLRIQARRQRQRPHLRSPGHRFPRRQGRHRARLLRAGAARRR